jgi:hypothetical protein
MKRREFVGLLGGVAVGRWGARPTAFTSVGNATRGRRLSRQSALPKT